MFKLEQIKDAIIISKGINIDGSTIKSKEEADKLLNDFREEAQCLINHYNENRNALGLPDEYYKLGVLVGISSVNNQVQFIRLNSKNKVSADKPRFVELDFSLFEMEEDEALLKMEERALQDKKDLEDIIHKLREINYIQRGSKLRWISIRWT